MVDGSPTDGPIHDDPLLPFSSGPEAGLSTEQRVTNQLGDELDATLERFGADVVTGDEAGSQHLTLRLPRDELGRPHRLSIARSTDPETGIVTTTMLDLIDGKGDAVTLANMERRSNALIHTRGQGFSRLTPGMQGDGGQVVARQRRDPHNAYDGGDRFFDSSNLTQNGSTWLANLSPEANTAPYSTEHQRRGVGRGALGFLRKR